MDDTSELVQRLILQLAIPIDILSVELPPELAHAGYARQLVMQKAAELARDDAVLMTTDADARVASNWLSTNLSIIREGVDFVAGRTEIDLLDAARIPRKLHEDDARECRYAQLVDEIHALLDPDSADPWPRHTEHSGASLTVTMEAYRRADGIPAVSPGEDRAFVEALRKVDARIRHAPEVRVVVSGRINGRAAGGMADTIRRRLVQPDSLLDEQLEPAFDAARRASMRRSLRVIWEERGSHAMRVKMFADNASLSYALLTRLISAPYFGEAWAELESRSAVLRRKRVRVPDLGNQVAKAEFILRILRDRKAIRQVPPDPVGNSPLDAVGVV
jgi:hypothetical protein